MSIDYSLLLSLIGISLTSVPLVGVLVTLGLREDIFPSMRGALLRSGGLAIVFFVLAAIAPLLGLSSCISVQWAWSVGLGVFAAAVGALISVAIFFAQVLITVGKTSVLSGRFSNFIMWFAIFLPSFAFMIVEIQRWGWVSIPAFVFMGFVGGHFICGCMMFDYMRYGVGNFKECFSADEFYEEMEALIEEASELRITATTPGLILISEYDPVKYPIPGKRKNPNRKALVNLYFNYARKGVKTKYIANEEGIKNYTTIYSKFGIYDQYKKASLKLFLRARRLKALEIRTLKMEAKSKFARVTCISDQAIALSTRDTMTRKIKYGEIIRNPSKARKLAEQFDSEAHWGTAKKLTPSEFQKLWAIEPK